MDNRIRAMLQRETNKWLTETCTLLKRQHATGPEGAPVEEYQAVATLPCRIITETQGARGVSEAVAARETITDSYRVVLPAGTLIDDKHRIERGGFTYEVVGILDKRTDGNEVQVRARRMRGT